jgi:hypothetical protein
MTSPLENLCGPGRPLKPEPPDAAEIAGLVRAGLARLNDAQNITLSLESRFDLAYNAAHALSLAALRRAGFRPSNRYIVFQVLPHTLALDAQVWRVLAKCHDMRNAVEYSGAQELDERLLADLLVAAQAVQEALQRTQQS